MNERIQDLAIEAAGRGLQTFATSDLDSPAKIERFAELIIRECVEVANKTVIGSDFVGNAIQKHFGVE